MNRGAGLSYLMILLSRALVARKLQISKENKLNMKIQQSLDPFIMAPLPLHLG